MDHTLPRIEQAPTSVEGLIPRRDPVATPNLARTTYDGVIRLAPPPDDSRYGPVRRGRLRCGFILMTPGAVTPMATLRQASLSDAPALGRLHVATWRESYADIMSPRRLASLSAATRAVQWGRILGEAPSPTGSHVFVVEQGDDLVGFGSCGRQRTRRLWEIGFQGEIEAIYIRKSAQGAGIGRRLMRSMAANLIERGFRGASLWVLQKNLNAQGFYSHLGGAVVGGPKGAMEEGGLAERAYGWPDLSQLL